MQNKGAIQIFTILLAITCAFYLSFTYVTYSVEKDAKEYAKQYISRADVAREAEKISLGSTGKKGEYIDSVYIARQYAYLDSIRKKPVYDIFITSFDYEDCKSREINLGLDLRGGMNVTLEVSVADIIRSLSNNNLDPVFNKAIDEAQARSAKSNKDFVALFADAFQELNPGGKLAAYFQTIELKDKIKFNSTDQEVLSLIRERVTESIETSERTLRARIDKFGVSTPNIQKLDVSGRILVELPGVNDPQRIRKLLQSTANLEFWETYENSEIIKSIDDANKRLKEILALKDTTRQVAVEPAAQPDTAALASNDSTGKDTLSTGTLAQQLGRDDTAKTASLQGIKTGKDTLQKMINENPLYTYLRPNYDFTQQTPGYGPVIGFSRLIDTAKVNDYLNDKRIRALFPPKTKFMWSIKAQDDDTADIYMLYAIKISTRDGKAPLYGDIISDARKEFQQQGSGSPQVSMIMKPEAAQVWKRLTRENIGKSIAVVLDNSVYTAPTVQGEIPNGTSQITGNFSIEEANDLVTILKAGKMPAKLNIVEETIVGPTLGQEAINSGLLSFLIALGVVFLFMGFYYNKSGWVADIALFANIFFIMGVLSSLNAVLSLPGIAGIVLTIGLSVDANILIYERVREELRLGKGVALAIKEGFRHAMSSILDSNITLLILGVILFTYGTGPVQGFATTLIIGILSSLFCAIFITRMVFDSLLKKNKSISFWTPLTKNAFKNININFVKKRKLYYLSSALVIALGIVFYIKNDGFKMGVDFKGGRTYIIRFDKEVPTEDVRNVLTANFDDIAPEVKTFGSGNQQKITTSYLIDDIAPEVEEKLQKSLKAGLDKLNVGYEIMSSQKVGETISRDIKTKAIGAVLLSCLLMFIYIFIRFKKWQFGMGAVIALFHDVLIVLSFYAIFDGLLPFSLEIDQHFIAAILTVMGYTMTESVIVFDRIREFLTEKGKKDMEGEEKVTLINYALNSTLSRTVNTSLTIFFVLLVIFIFGGEVIRGFTFALLIGRIIGTYSSLCISTPIVIDFDKKPKKVIPITSNYKEGESKRVASK